MFNILLFKAEVRLNITEEFSPFLKHNTSLHHYKDQLVKAVQENNIAVYTENHAKPINNKMQHY
jgi:hypothetical protein